MFLHQVRDREPCRRDLARCPNLARACPQCPHRHPQDGFSAIRSLGRVTTRSRTRLPLRLRLAQLRDLALGAALVLLFLCLLVIPASLGVWLARSLAE